MFILVAAVALLSISTGAFGSTVSDRGVDVNVVQDGDAYLGLELHSPLQLDSNVTADQNLGKITNQYDSTFGDISVNVLDPSRDDKPALVRNSLTWPTSLEPGESGWIRSSIDCGVAGNTETFELTITAESQDATLELSRDISIECEGDNQGSDAPQVYAHNFRGCSEVWIVFQKHPSTPLDTVIQFYNSTTGLSDELQLVIRSNDLEAIPGHYGAKPLYKFNIHDRLDRSYSDDDKLLAVSVSGHHRVANDHIRYNPLRCSG